VDYIISDTHFGHANIIKYSPYRERSLVALGLEPTIENHDQVLETAWNRVVNANDTVYFLGDLGMFFDSTDFVNQLARLKGQKIFFKGNHDRSRDLTAAILLPETRVIAEHDTSIELRRDKQKFMLGHYATLIPRPHVSVHGHTHEMSYNFEYNLTLNVSVDSEFFQNHNGYEHFGEPLPLATIVDEIKKMRRENKQEGHTNF
jgi:calcineurin-like phosphoesterase family protein